MTLRKNADYVYYGLTKSLCGTCKKGVDAKILFRDGAVYFDKFCPDHGKQNVLVSSSAEWYLDALSFVATHQSPVPKKEVSQGCPFDCGPCGAHQQKVAMPVIPITSACNLDCPICYTVNKNEGAHHLSVESFQKILTDLLLQHKELDILNFTGGEPTLHPHLIEILELCKAAGVPRLTISTNGLKLLDENYVKKLAAVDARIVLSFDTFDKETDQALLGANTVGAKQKVLDLLEKHDVTTTILPAVATGYNDREVGDLLSMVLRRPHLLSLEVHTLTFTGQGGVAFERGARITVPDIHKRIEESTKGKITPKDYVPSPLAHPHCYSICYLLKLEDDDNSGEPDFVPFSRFLSRQQIFELLQDSLYIEPREKTETVLRDAIDRLWSDPDSVQDSERILSTLKKLVKQMYPSSGAIALRDRQRIAERTIKAIYIHSHMDEESFDVGRLMKCSIGVPEEDGTNIPTCAYNVIYREKDSRFASPEMLSRIDSAKKRSLPLV